MFGPRRESLFNIIGGAIPRIVAFFLGLGLLLVRQCIPTQRSIRHI
jgi:hypothetical protein